MRQENPHLIELKRRVAKLTTKPGIYRWLDAKKTVLYVGKAKNLRNRVKSYLGNETAQGPWKTALMRSVADVDATVTNTELEALILETNLIKKLKPKFNVLMKDDKNYVYVRITLGDPFPRIDVLRKPAEDKARYFGPFTSAFEIRETLTLLRKVFPYRTCKMDIRVQGASAKIPLAVSVRNRDRPTPCLDFHLKQCTAPCIGSVAPEKYREESIEGVIDFLKGKTEEALGLLEERMKIAARERKFELAAKLRDALRVLGTLQEKQIVSDTSGESADIIGVAMTTNRAHVVLFEERDGKVIAESSFSLEGRAENAAEVLAQFLPQYYSAASEVPPLVIVAEELEERETLEEFLKGKRGSRVAIFAPERGKKDKLLSLASKNAQEKAKQFETKWESAARNVEQALEELKDAISLPALPSRIEAYDISHLGGTETVGSMSVFLEGKPRNDHYRSFTIRTMKEGDIDDYRALEEVLRRRLLHLKADTRQEQREWKKKGIVFGKARKNEHRSIMRIHEDHYREINDEDIDFSQYLIARRGDDIVGFCRMVEHEGGHKELKSLWVHEDFRGEKLGQCLARKILAQQKKMRKVYITAKTPLVEYYSDLGFRPIDNPPQIIVEKHERAAKKKNVPTGIVMAYIYSEHRDDASLKSKPDLLLIDGGKGQLSTVLEVLNELKLEIPLIALAKQEEEVFVPGMSAPLPLLKDSQARFLLVRLRDEAHRFANAHREKRGSKHAVVSALDSIPGIGPTTRLKLIRRFGSLSGVKSATDEDLRSIVGEEQLAALRNALRS